MVEEVREELAYSLGQLKLVIPGSGTMTRHGFECRLRCLNGTRPAVPEYTTLLSYPPIAGQLYLDPETNAELIPVLPFFVADLGSKPIFYFYSRKNRDKHLFVSRNCEIAPERELSPDDEVHLLEIFDRLVAKEDLECAAGQRNKQHSATKRSSTFNAQSLLDNADGTNDLV